MEVSAGIDFGTSNSTVSYTNINGIEMVELENGQTTIPTAMFFRANSTEILYGNNAVEIFLRHDIGRFMKSIKSILGTSLMDKDTRINNRLVDFETIIGYFISHLKSKLDMHVNDIVDCVVMGRPVKFHEYDEKLDVQAQKMLETIARNSGFKFVEFQYEPVAAAFAHEQDIQGEKLAVVVDIGGGTSDFTVIKLGETLKNKFDRRNDILANFGIKVGGNTFDKDLAFNAFMPVLGKGTYIGEKLLPMPNHIYSELSDWSSINFIYTPKTSKIIKEFYSEAHDKIKVGRLVEIVESKCAHELLRIVEQAKIGLTIQESVECTFVPVKDIPPNIVIKRHEFDDYSAVTYEKIQKAMTECMIQSGKSGTDIDLVVLTGGSTEIVHIKDFVRESFPNAEISDKNRLSSVGVGLAYDARRRFLR
jgi:hypothetical chaperone protein